MNIALLGLGQVGSAVYKYFERLSSGESPRITRILVKDLDRTPSVTVPLDRSNPALRSLLTKDYGAILNDDSIEVAVELTGDSKAADEFIIPALNAGKHVVTANKETLALNWGKVHAAATSSSRMVKFDAAVGGGVPIIRVIHSHASLAQASKVVGILNGTANFLLSHIKSGLKLKTPEYRTIDQGIPSAAELGLCEPGGGRPENDLDGTDTKYKIAILANLAFGTETDVAAIHCEGIANNDYEIKAADFYYVSKVFPRRDQEDYDIKLLGIAEKNIDGAVTVRVHPSVIPSNHLLSYVEQQFNGILTEASLLNKQFFFGMGAGPEPTSVSIAAGVSEIMNSFNSPSESHFRNLPEAVPMRKLDELSTSGLVRSYSPDNPGIFRQKLEVLEKFRINVQRSDNLGELVDRPFKEGDLEPDYIHISPAIDARVQEALAELRRLPDVTQVCYPSSCINFQADRQERA